MLRKAIITFLRSPFQSSRQNAHMLLNIRWMSTQQIATTFQQVPLSFNICWATNVKPCIKGFTVDSDEEDALDDLFFFARLYNTYCWSNYHNRLPRIFEICSFLFSFYFLSFSDILSLPLFFAKEYIKKRKKHTLLASFRDAKKKLCPWLHGSFLAPRTVTELTSPPPSLSSCRFSSVVLKEILYDMLRYHWLTA